jgi:hypothetical protein
LAVELIVQIPFVGLHVLQAVFGIVSIVLAVVAVYARRHGWRPRNAESDPTEEQH